MRKLALTLALIPSLALAIGEPQSPADIIGMLPTLLSFVQQGKWLLVGALITLVLVWAIRQYVLPKLGMGSASLPMVSALLGVVVGLAVSVLGGASPSAALLAVMSGPLASTLWGAIVKFFLPQSDSQPAAPSEQPPKA